MRYLSILFLFVTYFSHAQFVKETAVNASIGYGFAFSFSDDGTDESAVGKGIFLKGEYVMRATSWFELRPYAALIFTGSDEISYEDRGIIETERTNANGLLLGGKFRLTIPIPYVAPFLETGIGASFGEFQTEYTTIEYSENFTYHIPVTLGVSLGKNRFVNFGFEYFFMQDVQQFVGAATIGATFSLDKKEKND